MDNFNQDHFHDNLFDMGGPMGPNSNLAPLGNVSGAPGTRTPSDLGGQNVAVWQDTHYMGNRESGFISGATSQRTSITGHEDNLDEGLISGHGSIAGSFYDLDSGAPTEVNSLASNHPMLEDPVEHIPQLVTSLRDEDTVIVTESLYIVEKCLKKDSFNAQFFFAMIQNPHLITALVETIWRAFQIAKEKESNQHNGVWNDHEAKEAFESAIKRIRIASDILRQMTNPSKEHGQASNYQCIACRNIYLAPEGISSLVLMLLCHVPRIRYNGIIAIHHLLIYLKNEDHNGVKNLIKEKQGVEAMTKLLDYDNPTFLRILCDCLKWLALKDKRTKAIILKLGGTAKLLEFLKKRKWNQIFEINLRLIQVLSADEDNKVVLLKNQGIETLIEFLAPSNGGNKLASCAALAIRNMSNNPTGIGNPDRMADSLIRALQHPDIQVATCVAEIVSNFVVNPKFAELKFAFIKVEGIQRMLECLNTSMSNDNKYTGSVLCALRHLTSQQPPHKEQVLQVFNGLNNSGLNRIKRWVSENAARPCLKAALGIVKNFSAVPAYHGVLLKEQFVDQILQIFIYFFDEVDYEMAGIDHSVDNVKIIDLLDLLVICINFFTKTPDNRNMIRDRTIVTMLKTLLTIRSSSKNLHQFVLGILNELAKDREGACELRNDNCQSIREIINFHQNAQDNSPQRRLADLAIDTMRRVEEIDHQIRNNMYIPPQPVQHYRRTQKEQHFRNSNPPSGPPVPNNVQPHHPPHGAYPNNQRPPFAPNMPPSHGPPGMPPNGGFNQPPFQNFPPNMGPGFDMSDAPPMGPGGPPPPGMYNGPPMGPGGPGPMGPGGPPPPHGGFDDMDQMFDDPGFNPPPPGYFGGPNM